MPLLDQAALLWTIRVMMGTSLASLPSESATKSPGPGRRRATLFVAVIMHHDDMMMMMMMAPTQ